MADRRRRAAAAARSYGCRPGRWRGCGPGDVAPVHFPAYRPDRPLPRAGWAGVDHLFEKVGGVPPRRLSFCRRRVLVSAVVRTDVRKVFDPRRHPLFIRERVSRRVSRLRHPRSAALRGPGIRGFGPRDKAGRRSPPPTPGGGRRTRRQVAGRVWCGEASHPAGLQPGLLLPVEPRHPACLYGRPAGAASVWPVAPSSAAVRFDQHVGCGTGEEKRPWRAPRPTA